MRIPDAPCSQQLHQKKTEYSQATRMGTIRGATLKALLIAFLGCTPAWAWDSVIKVDGVAIPEELYDGYQVYWQEEREKNCQAASREQFRDNVTLAWIKVQSAEAGGVQLDESREAELKELEAKLLIDDAQGDESYRNRLQWDILRFKSVFYWNPDIQDSYGVIKEADIRAEYDRLVALKDPRLVDVPFYRIMVMESSKEYVDSIAARLRSGELWRSVSLDVDQYDWNSHNADQWVLFKDLAGYPAGTFYELNLDSNDLQRNDVIGPVELKGRVRLVVILDKVIEPVVPINASIRSSDNWAYKMVEDELKSRKYDEFSEALLEGVEITENDETISISVALPSCW